MRGEAAAVPAAPGRILAALSRQRRRPQRTALAAAWVSLAGALAMAAMTRPVAQAAPGGQAVPGGQAAHAAVAAATAVEPPGAADTGSLDEVLALLATRRHGHVTFTEVHTLAILDRPLESSGELRYDAPDRLEKRTLRPKPETLLLEHGVLTARRGQRTWVLSLDQFPQALPFIESIRATLAGDRSGLERFFKLTFSGSVAAWSLILVPSDATIARRVKDIRIEGERDLIRTVRISETDGDGSLLTIGPEVSP